MMTIITMIMVPGSKANVDFQVKIRFIENTWVDILLCKMMMMMMNQRKTWCRKLTTRNHPFFWLKYALIDVYKLVLTLDD